MMPEPSDERAVIALFERLLEQPEDQRDAWLAAETAGQPSLRARVEAMRAADRVSSLRTGGAGNAIDDDIPPARIGAYRIVARIGRGGMGSVYRGERATGDFDHAVAIKVIKPGLLSEALVERFARERQTLAALSHPHIAQLYDGGATERSAPYIVMELVDGLPLLQYVADRAAGPRERLRLFAQICAAVAFAHRNLIVHRDLTPSNVLVTHDGRIKLIDFGIARPADSAQPDSTASSLGSLSLTPGYAAPERMAGSGVATAADIFSLGRLLDRLVPEYDSERAAIVARATAIAPADRYPTVDALAEDVAAWVDGRPVAAVDGGAGYRARKFVARHRLPVAAAALALVVLIGALTTAVIANHRTDIARAEAERRFEQTRAIANTMIFDAFDAVSRVPGATRAREVLARAGLRYLDALAADRSAPFAVRVETGRGYARLADVIGSGQAGTLGKIADGNVLLARADAILARAYAERPDDTAARRAYAAVVLERAGVDLYNNNDVAAARAGAVRARSLIAPIARADPDAARIYLTSFQAEADSRGWEDDWPNARKLHLRGEAFAAGLPAALRDAKPVQMARSGNLRLLGEAHHKLKETEPARQALDRAVAINEALLAADPRDPVLLRKVATSNWYRAVVHRTNDRDAAAGASIARAVAAASVLRDRDPNDAGSAHIYAITAEVQAQVLMDLGRRDEAFATNAAVDREYARLVALSGDAPGMRRSWSAALRTIGGNYYNGGDYGRACAAWTQSRDLLRWIDAHGALTETDRKNGVANVDRYLAGACVGVPHPGHGPRVD